MSSNDGTLSLWQTIWYSFVLALYRLYKFLLSITLRRFSQKYMTRSVKYVFRKRFDVYIDRGQGKSDPVIHDTRFYRRVAENFTLGLGESYMDGWWDVDDLGEMMFRFFRSPNFYVPFTMRLFHALGFNGNVNRQLQDRSKYSVKRHYDLGNDLFVNFLGKTLNYSSGYWAKADNLDQAQIDKMELIAQKLKLKPGMKLLDIGFGWGGIAKYLAENHGVTVVGYTISKAQLEFGRELCKELPNVEFRYGDYRSINEKFDRIYSIEMMEHVGVKNFRTFFEVANRCLDDDGLFLVQTNILLNRNLPRQDEWFDKHIFPDGEMPYDVDLFKESEGLFFVEDFHNMSSDYPKTLEGWYENFKSNWPKLQGKYDERFYRMWTYYLCIAMGGHKSRAFGVCQVVLSKRGILGGYQSGIMVLRKLLEEDQRLTVDNVAGVTHMAQPTSAILTQELDMTKVSARWVCPGC
ncbi:unnamed protein product [Cyprideis torosa]|uniref:Uncharacterized protein n=1 Tax=Cyprideis torosa TaxID=163714 RepID=A0A7R8WID2_9CRUS|nr:unnamed protein product [Cyprideis torosa]CAG0897755.1 unnamed protein product [Cyprideis torosa]